MAWWNHNPPESYYRQESGLMASRLSERIMTTQSGLSFLCFIVAFVDSFPPGNENWYWNQRGEEGRRGVGEGRSAAFESAGIRNPVSQHPRPLEICPSADLRGFQACLFSVTSITVCFPYPSRDLMRLFYSLDLVNGARPLLWFLAPQ